MPDIFFPWMLSTDWIVKELARFGVTVGIGQKRPRRAVSYADELLHRAAGRINYGKSKGRRRR